MRRSRGLFLLLFTGLVALGVTAGCSRDATAPAPARQFDEVASNSASEGNGVLVEVGEHRAPFGVVVTDDVHHLLLYYRWDNGFCGGVTPTEFVLSTYHDVIRVDETWQTLDKTDGYWFYVYDWNGTPAFPGCGFLRSNTPIATGRGRRLLHDNDFYPFAPYAPGPGANAYMEQYIGSLTTPAGDPVQFLGQIHATVSPDGNTFVHWTRSLQLSPDPR